MNGEKYTFGIKASLWKWFDLAQKGFAWPKS